MRRSALVVLLAALALLAACGEAATPTPEPTPEATPTPEPTPEPTAEPTATDDDGTGGLPGFGMNEDPELAATIPSTVGDHQLEVASFRGDSMAAGGFITDPSMQEFLDEVGASASDLSVAVGSGGDQTGGGEAIVIMAIRVAGGDGDQLMEQFLGVSEETTGLTGWTQDTVAGKQVQTASIPGMEAFGSFYLYVTGDTLYYVFGSGDLATEALSQLP